MGDTHRRWEKYKDSDLHPMWYCPTCQREWGDPTNHEIAERACEPCLQQKAGLPHSGTDVLIPGHGYVTREEAAAIAGTEKKEEPTLEATEEDEGGLADA